MARGWTQQEELDLVIAREQGRSHKDLARQYGRTVKAISIKLSKLRARGGKAAPRVRRFYLNAAGQLRSIKGPRPRDIVAIVNVRPKQSSSGVPESADRAGGRDGRAPEGSSGVPAAGHGSPANARQLRKQTNRIDLSAVPSSMEQQAARWAGERCAPIDRDAVAKAAAEGKAWCRCGGRTRNGGGPVPASFGRDCIERDCPLKAVA